MLISKTFDNFMVDENNKAAFTAALNAENHALPLFLYGRSGMGKTHLLCAIGEKAKREGKTACFITTEKLVNYVIDSLKGNMLETLCGLYLKNDVLLIDNIDFLCSRPATLKEVLKIILAMRDGGKTVVMTSERPLSDFSELEKAFEKRGGFISCYIGAPTYSTAKAYVVERFKNAGIAIDRKAVFYIAKYHRGNFNKLASFVTTKLFECSQDPIEEVTTQWIKKRRKR